MRDRKTKEEKTDSKKTHLDAGQLFERVREAVGAIPSATVNRQLHETLELCCDEALRNTPSAFGNLFSKVAHLCKHHHVSPADTAAIQTARRDGNRREPLSAEDALYDCRALAVFISAVFSADIPPSLTGRLPVTGKPVTRHHIDYRCIRCIVERVEGTTFTALADSDGDTQTVRIGIGDAHLAYLAKILRPGMQLNLLDCTTVDGLLAPQLVVVEPDYLLDISSVAACFNDYGHHPLSMMVRRMAPAANSQAILVGNFAGRALDDIVNATTEYHWQDTFRTSFKEHALEYCACPDLDPNRFRQAVWQQTKNIEEAYKALTPPPALPFREGAPCESILTPNPTSWSDGKEKSVDGDKDNNTDNRSNNIGDRDNDTDNRSNNIGDKDNDTGDRSNNIGDKDNDTDNRSNNIGDRDNDTGDNIGTTSSKDTSGQGVSTDSHGAPSLKGRAGGGVSVSLPLRSASPDIYYLLKEYQKEKRNKPTDAEKKMWEILKENDLGVRFRRQFVIDDFIVDFVCLPLALVIEVDGGYHQQPHQRELDKYREDVLKEKGCTILRFTNKEVMCSPASVISRLKDEVARLKERRVDGDKDNDTDNNIGTTSSKDTSGQGVSTDSHGAPSLKGRAGGGVLPILEPTFVCERLGLQGRVDLMSTDFRLLVEQKAGKNFHIQSQHPGPHGYQIEKHYVQLLLYYGVLRYNFGLSRDHTDCLLLYSRYPMPSTLIEVGFYRDLFREAIKVRNQVVATDFLVAREGFGRILPLLQPATLNVTHAADRFFQQWREPQIAAVTAPLHRLSALERAYFCAMMTFVMREQVVAKVGAEEGVAGSQADLWNMPLAEKKETGNIYTGLTITDKAKSEGASGFDTITLAVPGQGDDFLPNFRRGDLVYLYAYPDGEEPDVRRAFLFKGALADIRSDRLTVRLGDAQQNPAVFEAAALMGRKPFPYHYAVEHGGSDSMATAAMRSLHEFITSPQACRDLLLGQREPRADTSLTLTRSYHAAYDDILLRARQATDCFLLVGPPGTGKTSLALQFMVREGLAVGDDLLLMAYTNRAVDEICAMLDAGGIGFIRIGNEYSCDSRFRDRLLASVAARDPRLENVRRRLKETHVIVGTTSTIQSHSYLFRLKTFQAAIVDEASQILEPGLVGLLSRVGKFVLIGDHKQLPAVVQQNAAMSATGEALLHAIGLTDCRTSLFQRLLDNERRHHRTAFTGILDHQGRMHPAIADFPDTRFYLRENLKPVPLPHQTATAIHPAASGKAQDGLADTFLLQRRMVFIPSADCRRPDLSDKVNTSEAAIVARLLADLYRLYGPERFDAARTVGVIVPYRNQIAMIRRHLEPLGIPALMEVSIDTVERYQGSQRDVIIYSFTVQRPWQLDFLTASSFDEDGRTIDRKLNVAITRARKQLVMTGNERVLRQNALFADLIAYVKAHNGYIDTF